MLNIESLKSPGKPSSKSVSQLRGTINEHYSELNDIQRLKARKVLILCDEVMKKENEDKFNDLLEEANKVFLTIRIFD